MLIAAINSTQYQQGLTCLATMPKDYLLMSTKEN